MKIRNILKGRLTESIIVTDLKHIGDITEPTLKYWKKNPSDFTSACQAAMVYSKKFNEDMVVLPGNSYMSRVYQIVRKTEDVSKYIPASSNKTVKCAVVNSTGKVFSGIIEPTK